MAVAEPSAQTAVGQEQHINSAIYGEVVSLMGHHQKLMSTAPEAWKLANDIAAVAYAYTQTPLDLREYETQFMITDDSVNLFSETKG